MYPRRSFLGSFLNFCLPQCTVFLNLTMNVLEKKPQTSLFVFNKLLTNVIVFLLVLQLRKTLNSQFTFSFPFRGFTELQNITLKHTCFPSQNVLNYSVNAHVKNSFDQPQCPLLYFSHSSMVFFEMWGQNCIQLQVHWSKGIFWSACNFFSNIF